MVRLAFISSTKFPELSDKGLVEMSLAHLVLKDEEYANRLLRLSLVRKHIILDNSAFEMQSKGRGVADTELIRAAERIQAHEIICPDILYDGQATCRATESFVEHNQSFLARTKLMGVPQGRTREEWMTCLVELDALVDTIGLSKLSVATCFQDTPGEPLAVTRLRALQATTLTTSKPIHLLGADWSLPVELAIIKHVESVRSVDTSYAYWYAYNGKSLFDPIRRFRGDLEVISLPELEIEVPNYVKERALNNADVLLSIANGGEI